MVATAIQHRVFGVCVAPVWVPMVRDLLGAHEGPGQRIAIVTVAGFPTGASTVAAKAFEAARAALDGADEIDMVLSLPKVLSVDTAAITAEVSAVREAVRAAGEATVKVIVESALLDRHPDGLAALRAVAAACAAGGAEWVKTSTGMHPAGGATVDAVRALHAGASPAGARVKASGGIGDAAFATALLAAGAERLGVGVDRAAGLLSPAGAPDGGSAGPDGY
jgi:deoxyribose-phosphate aldolase